MSFLPSSRTIPHAVLSTSTEEPQRVDEVATPIGKVIAKLIEIGESAALIPQVELSPVSQPTKARTMTTPVPGSFTASIRAMMDEARASLEQARTDGLSQVKEAVGELVKAKAAVVQVSGTMAQTIKDEAASVMSELGQISNLPPE